VRRDHPPECQRKSRCQCGRRCGRARIAALNVRSSDLCFCSRFVRLTSSLSPILPTYYQFQQLLSSFRRPCIPLSQPPLTSLGRRRKIRCIYQADNPDVCSECFARGSRCIDQESANPEVIVDHRKNLRERVSRLEALVDSLLEEKTVKSESPSQQSRSQSLADTTSPKNVYTRDFPPTPLSSEDSSNILKDSQKVPSNGRHHIPILSIFEDAVRDRFCRLHCAC
jgi:hypothetical protein